METKQNKERLDDMFLKNILEKSIKKEKASKDFTKKTMDLVMQEWLANPIEQKNTKHGYKYWLILISLIIITVLAYLATDTRKLITMTNISWLKSLDQHYLVYIHSLYSNILDTFLNLSPIFYILIAALFSIFLADKLIRKLQSSFFSIFFI